MNCQIKKIIISISSLGSTLSGDHIAVHVYASNEAEKLLVGRVDFLGKTDAGFKRSLNVICPDGFTLTATVVDECGIPNPFSDNWGVTVSEDLYYPTSGFLTPEKAISNELSGAAGDVLHALFFRGALVDGDLPSKSGAAELRELGYVKTQDTVTPFGGEHHFNFLTPAGQEFAISYLVDSKFGKRPPRSVRELVIKTSIDASELQSTVNEVLDSIRKSDVFKVLSGQTFINDAVIKDGSIRAEWLLNIPDSDEKPSVVFKADCFKVTDGVNDSGESTIQQQIQQAANAVIEATKAALARQDAAMADLASTQAAITESINKAVSDAIANVLKPGGLLYARK